MKDLGVVNKISSMKIHRDRKNREIVLIAKKVH